MRTGINQETIANIFAKYNFVMTTAQLKTEGIYYANIVSLLDNGVIEKVISIEIIYKSCFVSN